MRIVDQPIQVVAGPDGSPRAFLWRGRRYTVEAVLEDWVELGEWWDCHPPEQRSVFRVRAGSGVFELDFRRPEKQWYLYCIYD